MHVPRVRARVLAVRLAVWLTASLTACSCALYASPKASRESGTGGQVSQAPQSTTVSMGGPDGAGHAPPPAHDELVTLPDSRQYLVGNLPTDGVPHPMMIVLGGLYVSPQNTERATNWTSFAWAHDWAVVYGVGQHESWDAGTCCGYAANQGTDDVAYLRSVVADVQRFSMIDPRNIYLAGFSNGGMLAADAACEMPNVFAAVVTVSGPLLVPSQGCSPTLALHGIADATVPVDGGYSKVTGTYLPSTRFIASTQQAAGNIYDLAVLDGTGHAWPTRLNGQPAAAAIVKWLTQHRLNTD